MLLELESFAGQVFFTWPSENEAALTGHPHTCSSDAVDDCCCSGTADELGVLVAEGVFAVPREGT